MKKKSDFVGTWRLVQFRIYLGDLKEEFLPYGEMPVGYLIYTEGGFVSVHFMRKERHKCSSDDYKNTTVTEKVEIAENYGGYVGTYEIKDDVVIHYPEVCTFPNFIQVPQIRLFSFFENKLTLQCSYLNKPLNVQGRSEIIWEKVSLNTSSYGK